METMPPTGTHADAQKRAHDAYRLRCTGRTWDDIAKAKGYKSPAGAFKAVKRYVERMPPEDQAIARAMSAGNYRLVMSQLYDVAASAKAQNRTTSAVQALQAIADVQDKHDRLVGLHIVQPTKVELTVTSAVSVLERAEEELLAIAGQHAATYALPVIDAEVIEA